MITINDEKIILLGDTHFGVRNDALNFHRQFERFYNFLFKYMKDNDFTTIVQFGDLFDRRKYIQFNSLKESRRYFFDKLKEYNFKLYTLIGNHDIPSKNTLEGNSPSLLLNEYNYEDYIYVIQEPTEIKLGQTNTLVIPWICSNNMEACSAAIEKTTSPICFGHFEIIGAEMYKGSFCTHGISKDLFWKFKDVYTGHFHTINKIDNIQYLGSPYQLTWADYGDERGFFTFDTTTQETEFVKNPYENFHKITYDDSKINLDKIEKIDYTTYQDSYVKVVKVKCKDSYVLEKFVQKLEDVGADVTTVDDHKNKNLLKDSDIVQAVDDINTTFKKISIEYKDSVDPSKLEQYLMELYVKANNI